MALSRHVCDQSVISKLHVETPLGKKEKKKPQHSKFFLCKTDFFFLQVPVTRWTGAWVEVLRFRWSSALLTVATCWHIPPRGPTKTRHCPDIDLGSLSDPVTHPL